MNRDHSQFTGKTPGHSGHFYRIRPYTGADSERIKELFIMLDYYSCAILPESLKKFEETENLRKALDAFIKRKKVKGGRRKTFVAEAEDGILAGFISGSVSKEYPGFRLSVYGDIEVFFVQEKHRGRGAGRQLYNAMEEWFRGKKCEAARADTWIFNEPAIAVYRSLGFEKIAVMFVKELKR